NSVEYARSVGKIGLPGLSCPQHQMSLAMQSGAAMQRAGEQMGILSRRRAPPAITATVAIGLAAAVLPRAASLARTAPRGSSQAGADVTGLSAQLSAYGDQRLSPAGTVQPGAYGDAWNHILGMPVQSDRFSEVTTQPYNSDSLHFRDQVASNSGGGAGFSSGRLADENPAPPPEFRSEEHTSELPSLTNLLCPLLLSKTTLTTN